MIKSWMLWVGVCLSLTCVTGKTIPFWFFNVPAIILGVSFLTAYLLKTITFRRK